jgi:dimethylhistidine N-methyltransferase
MTPSSITVSRHEGMITWNKRFQRDVIDGLSRPQKETPCKYLYDERGSALFDEICELDEYYLTRAELAILRQDAALLADAIGAGCELIEFGSGVAQKTRLLLEHLESPRAYLPIDVARGPLERSALDLAGRFPGLRVLPVHADFTAPLTLPDTGNAGARRVVYFPGSTIGNFSPQAAVNLLIKIAWLVGKGGGLLIGFDIDKDESIVWPAYNDSLGVTAAFNLNLLERINRELDTEIDVAAFAHRADYVRSKERVEMHLVSLRRQAVRIGGTTFVFREGETILTEYSYKYSLGHFGRLTARAGFRMAQQWQDPMGYFAVQHLVVDS